MSDVLVTYKQQNKFDKYYVLPTTEKTTIDNLTTNFLQELVTKRGSCAFDKEYGSTFIEEVGDHANIYKIQYILDKSIEGLKEKYGIDSVVVSNSIFNNSNGFLEIHMRIEYEDVAVEKHFNFMYNGIYTDKMILEID